MPGRRPLLVKFKKLKTLRASMIIELIKITAAKHATMPPKAEVPHFDMLNMERLMRDAKTAPIKMTSCIAVLIVITSSLIG